MFFGGAERVMSVLANEWAENGIESRILLANTEEGSVYPLAESISVVSCWADVRRAPVGQLAIIRAVRRQCKKWKPDVLLCFYNDLCALCAVAIRGMGIRLVYSVRNDPQRTNQRKIDKIYRKIVERRADCVVFQSNGAKRCYPEYVQRKSRVILNPMRTEGFPIHDFEKEDHTIVSVGRLVPQKNQKLLIKAFSRIQDEFPDYRLVIYGEGSLRCELTERIRELGLCGRVSLPGTVRDVQNRIRDSSLFVLTSDYEGIPNALMEALALGLPCISTDCSPGGARELIRDGVDGLIVACGDHEALAQAMGEMLRNRERAACMGRAALHIRERADSQKIAGEWLEAICRGWHVC